MKEIEIQSDKGQSVVVKCSPNTRHDLEKSKFKFSFPLDEEFCKQVFEQSFSGVLENEDFVPIASTSQQAQEEKQKAVGLERDCQLLITIYKDVHPKLERNVEVKTKRRLWELISKKMNQHGSCYTLYQIEGKWKSLERAFKNKMLHNKKNWQR